MTEPFHIENWRLLGGPAYWYVVGDLDPGHITTSSVIAINTAEGWADTKDGRVTLGKPAARAKVDLRQATLDECLQAIDKQITRGPLPGGGDGCDAHAQRNGMVLAYNILFGLRHQSRRD